MFFLMPDFWFSFCLFVSLKLKTRLLSSPIRAVTCVLSWKARITCVSPGRSRVPSPPKQLNMIFLFVYLHVKHKHSASECFNYHFVTYLQYSAHTSKEWFSFLFHLSNYTSQSGLVLKVAQSRITRRGLISPPLAPRRRRASSKYRWSGSTGIKSITNVPSLCLPFAPHPPHLFPSQAKRMFFWMDRFFYGRLPPSFLAEGSWIVTICLQTMTAAGDCLFQCFPLVFVSMSVLEPHKTPLDQSWSLHWVIHCSCSLTEGLCQRQMEWSRPTF